MIDFRARGGLRRSGSLQPLRSACWALEVAGVARAEATAAAGYSKRWDTVASMAWSFCTKPATSV